MISTTIDNVYLILYAMLWFFTVYAYRKRIKQITLALSLLLLYACMAPVCIYLYNSEYAYLYYEKELTFVGFFYLYIMIMLALMPILGTKEEKLTGIWIPNSTIITPCCVVVSILCIYGFISCLPKLQEGLIIMLSGSDEIVGLYEDAKSDRMDMKSFSGSISFLNVLSNVSDFIIPILFFLYLLLDKKNKLVIVLLFLGLLKVPILGIANASRFQLISQVFVVFLLFFFFQPYMKQSIVKATKRIFVIVVSFIFVLFLSVSIVRAVVDNKSDTVYGLARYYAQGPIVFDNFCLDANGTREGHFTFPLVINALGGESMSENDLRLKYSHMKVDNSKFTTFVGDYVLDYGPIMAFMMFVLYSLYMSKRLKNKGSLIFSQLIILYLCMRFCCGFYQYQLGSTSGNLFVFLSLFLSMLFSNKKNQIFIERKSI